MSDNRELRAALSALFETHRVLNKSPRLAWGIVHDGHLAISGGHDADEHTVFRIASMTKSFTAAAVLALRDDAVFRLDDEIASIAPELTRIELPTRDSQPLTIRMLLTMSSGLATDDPWADRHLDFTDDELDRELAAGATFARAPGTGMQYSNLGYGLLGRVVLRATGRTVQQVVTERLLDPLGMHETHWSESTMPADADVARGVAYFGDDAQPVAHLGDGAIAPMGGIATTVADLAKWVTFFTDAYPARDDDDEGPLARSARREMQTAWTMFPPDVRTTLDGHTRRMQGGYGMGLMALHHDSLGAMVSHSGGLPGFGSNMRWLPDTGLGCIALANSTYARMADAALAAIELCAARTEWAHHDRAVTPAVQDAASALVALLNDWDDAVAATLCSDNVDMDLPFATRRAQAAELAATHGRLQVVRIDAMSWAEADIVVWGERSKATLRIEFQLSSQRPTRVQWYEVDDSP